MPRARATLADLRRILSFRSLGFARRQVWALPALVLMGVMAAAMEGIGIGMMIPLFAALFGAEADAGTLSQAFAALGAGLDRQERVLLLVGTILGLALAKAVVEFSYEALSIWLSGHLTYRLRTALVRQLLRVGYSFFGAQDEGRMFNIVKGETWMAGEFVMLLARAIISLCAMLVFAILLLLIAPGLTLAAAAGILVVSLLVRLVARRAEALGHRTFEASAFLSRLAIRTLNNMRVIRLFGQEGLEARRFGGAAWDARTAAMRVEMCAAMIRPATEMLYAPLFLGILLAAWASGTGLPTLIAVLVLLYRLQPHTRRLDQVRVEMAGTMPAVVHIAELLDEAGKPFIRSGNIPCEALGDRIRFEDVSFTYEGPAGARPAVRRLSFDIVRNSVTAIVGESGAGKSTAVGLLCRLYDPDSGRILVDGVPLDEIRISDWRSRLAFAGQDAGLIGDTIREAIRYGRPEAGEAEMREAAERAQAAGFIESLPHGYETVIGTGGTKLSAGQRQRIALARALLCKPDILVLDEATSALDAKTERYVQQALDRLKGTLTIVVIAHRLGTIRNADRVVLMHGGEIVEEGAPDELLRLGGRYAELYRLQTAGAVRLEPEPVPPERWAGGGEG